LVEDYNYPCEYIQIINLIFCKIYDERFTEPDEMITMRAAVGEDAQEAKDRILELCNSVNAIALLQEKS